MNTTRRRRDTREPLRLPLVDCVAGEWVAEPGSHEGAFNLDCSDNERDNCWDMNEVETVGE